jgi:hypothetical protein
MAYTVSRGFSIIFSRICQVNGMQERLMKALSKGSEQT